jgi:hypothetical protein
MWRAEAELIQYWLGQHAVYKKLEEEKFFERVPNVNMLRSRGTRDHYRALARDNTPLLA